MTLPSPRCVKSPEVRHFLVLVSCLYVSFSIITIMSSSFSAHESLVRV